MIRFTTRSRLQRDGIAATSAQLNLPMKVSVAPDGSVYIADGNEHVRRVRPPLAGFTGTDLVVPSEDGTLLYRFDPKGRHLETKNALTGAALFTFGYSDGLLTQVTDGDGKVTTVERGGQGDPTAIVAPFGQRTTLGVDSGGYLSSITNPNGETHGLQYAGADGLLTKLTDPRLGQHGFSYDSLGRLMNDTDPAGGTQDLTRAELAAGHEVTRTTGMSRTTRYEVERLPAGATNRVDTRSDGTEETEVIGTDQTRRTTSPDGTVELIQLGADPRFGLQAPLTASRTLTLPAPSLSSTTTTSRSVTLADPKDPLSLTQMSDTVAVNGRTFTSLFDRATRRFTLTSAAGRTSSLRVSPLGRPIETTAAGLETTTLGYNASGLLQSTARGSGAELRQVTLGYDAAGELSTLTDPLGRVTSFGYDAAGRMTSQTLPGDRTIAYAYDGNGNLASVIPPGRGAHVFQYTGVDLASEYDPPDLVGITTDHTTYTYNLDRQLELVTRPDGATIDYVYGATTGKLDSMITPRGTTSFGYNPTTGQLATITAPGNETISFAWDGFLPTGETWSGTLNGSVSRSFNSNFWLVSESVNGESAVSFTYDNDGLLTAAGAETLARSAQNGLLTASSLGNVTDTWGYNGFAEPASYEAAYGGSALYSAAYTRDKLGRITQKVETLDNFTDTYEYGYDAAGRLQTVTLNGTVISTYGYDTNGNRLSHDTPYGSTQGTYDGQDRLSSYGDASYTYTPNGELATKTDASGTTTYSYDVLGNLVAVTLPDGTQIDYVIDGRNRRIGKKVNGTLVQGWLYADQLRPIAEIDGSGAIVARFVYASKANVPDYVTKGGNTYRIVSNNLGSPRLIVDASSGEVAQQIAYDEFGNVLRRSPWPAWRSGSPARVGQALARFA